MPIFPTAPLSLKSYPDALFQSSETSETPNKGGNQNNDYQGVSLLINHDCLNSERFPILCLSIFLLGAKLGPFGDVLDSEKINEKSRLTIQILLKIPGIFSPNAKLFKPS